MFLAANICCLERVVGSEIFLVHVLKACRDAMQISAADKLAATLTLLKKCTFPFKNVNEKYSAHYKHLYHKFAPERQSILTFQSSLYAL